MFGSPIINLQKQPAGKSRMSIRGSSSETNRLTMGINVGFTNKRIQEIQKQPQLQKTTIKNDGPATPVVRNPTEKIKKMSFAEMIASAERLSKNLERKMTKPIIKKESKINVNNKQVKKVSTMTHAATVPCRSMFDVTKTKLLVPLTPKPARLQYQCTREDNITTSYIMPSNKKDMAVQTMPQNDTIDTQKTNESNWCDHDTIGSIAIKCSSFQQQPVDMGSVDGQSPQPFLKKTLNNKVPFKYIVKKFDKFLRKNMKATNLLKGNRDKLSAQRTVAAATLHNHWKHFMYFSSFTIGVITTYAMNYAWHCFQCIENSPLLLK